MSNDLKHALGDAPNSEFIIGPDGKFVVSNQWSNPNNLRDTLADLVGKADTFTSVGDLDIGSLAPAKTSAKGVVPRLQLPSGMSAAQVTPVERKSRSGKVEPYYVKLRAELDQSREQLYLGFYLDPIHKVHWNNLAEPLEFSIESPNGVSVTPATGTGPKVETPADADPREFLVKVDGQSNEPIKLTVRYFACDDADRFCKAMTQEYTIVMQRDNDGGSRRSAGGRPGGGRSRNGSGRPTQSPRGGGRPVDPLIGVLDKNIDGVISIDEIDASISALRKLDLDGDGNVSMEEIRRTRSGSPQQRQR